MNSCKFITCARCVGVRLHHIRVKVTKRTGHRVRIRVCSACSKKSPIPFAEQVGIACPKCQDIRLKVYSVRHRLFTTTRVKVCLNCGHPIRTVERFESYSA